MEFVYVVPRTALFPDFYPQGFMPFGSEARARDVRGPLARPGSDADSALSHGSFEAALERDGFFVERPYAERTPSLKQVIPYSIIECDGRVLLFQRLSTGGETRLHGKLSIGIGGHINPEDLDARQRGPETRESRSPVNAGTRREIEEELTIQGDYEIRHLGIINDDSNAVGAVHVGLVQVVHVNGSVEIRERCQLEGRLVPCEEPAALNARGANFETWSRMLLPHLGELLNSHIATHSSPLNA